MIPIDPVNALVSGLSNNNLVAGNMDAISGPPADILLHQGNGEKFMFQLPQPVETVPPNGSGTQGASVSTISSQSTSFGQLAQEMVRGVNSYQQVAGEKVRDVLMGGKTSIHEAMVSVQESTVAFELLAQVRNKLIDSYQELNRIQT